MGGAQIASLGKRVGIFSDVHGEERTLKRALEHCCRERVATIALLGDLFDRAEEADRCAHLLEDWQVIGVYGNHEKDIALAAAAGQIRVADNTARLLSGLQERIVLDDICLVHEAERWGNHDPVAAMFQRERLTNGFQPAAWLTFAGHTHVKSARTESGPLDISRGQVNLTSLRHYLINPGALAVGQYAILDREACTIRFHQLDDW